MKLLFPNGEHEPIELRDGDVLVGTAPECQIMLAVPGIVARHCALHSHNGQTTLKALDPQAMTVLNGKQLVGEAAIKPGDLLLFARVGVRVVAMEKTPVQMVRKAQGTGDDDGRTRVRMALPKFILRGVSGPTFGKTYAVVGAIIIGRSNDCDVCIPSDEISRHHAKLQVVPDGVMAEDLGSANGTFVANQRVHGNVLMKPGDELRLDTVRFMLMSPTMEAHAPAATAAAPAPASTPASGGTNKALWIVAGAVVLVVVVLGVLRALGKI
jgi:pSer/pThr/pTyr-binding forkhead associated (FHA) protein